MSGRADRMVTRAAAPDHRVGRGSQLHQGPLLVAAEGLAAPDRRVGRGSQPGPGAPGAGRRGVAAPDHRVGRGSQPPAYGCPTSPTTGCARPPRRARIATSSRSRTPRWGRRRCARPPRRARIATLVAVDQPACFVPAAPDHRVGRGSQHEYMDLHPEELLRAAPDHRVGRGSQPFPRPDVEHVLEAAPDHRVGRGSQPPPPAATAAATARAAPDHRVGRGSQLRADAHSTAAQSGRCARPPRRARIATPRGRAFDGGAVGALRPTTASGEDRNQFGRRLIEQIPHRAAPDHRVGRGSQPVASRPHRPRSSRLRLTTASGEDRNGIGSVYDQSLMHSLRPTTASGEDRNYKAFTGGTAESVQAAAPDHRVGRGSQRVALRAAGPEGRPAAPDHRVGRGSQRPVVDAGVLGVGALRPTTASGEDRNPLSGGCPAGVSMLRPTTASGEDRNPCLLWVRDNGYHAAPDHRVGRGSQHPAGGALTRRIADSCARPPRRARIATTRR